MRRALFAAGIALALVALAFVPVPGSAGVLRQRETPNILTPTVTDTATATHTAQYLALVFRPPPSPTPTHTPTPTPQPTPTLGPLPINVLALQLDDLLPGYTQDKNEELSNEAAAQNYDDPAAALAAFVAQGRETSWYVEYSSTDYTYSNALVIADQVFRYATIAGAEAGQYFVDHNEVQRLPGFANVSLPPPPLGDAQTALKRITVFEGRTFVHYYISVRTGRYVTNVSVIGLATVLTANQAKGYADTAFGRLP